MRAVVIAFLTAAALGCASRSGDAYIDPSSLVENMERRGQNEVIIEKDFDTVWSALIEYGSRHFFPITTIEKASGLLTFKFSAENPVEYVDCGTLDSPPGYYGPYLERTQKGGRADLQGIMNLYVKPIDGSTTRIIINSRYRLTLEGEEFPPLTWNFDTNTMQTRKAGLQNVTCMATLRAEKDVAEGIRQMTGVR